MCFFSCLQLFYTRSKCSKTLGHYSWPHGQKEAKKSNFWGWGGVGGGEEGGKHEHWQEEGQQEQLVRFHDRRQTGQTRKIRYITKKKVCDFAVRTFRSAVLIFFIVMGPGKTSSSFQFFFSPPQQACFSGLLYVYYMKYSGPSSATIQCLKAKYPSTFFFLFFINIVFFVDYWCDKVYLLRHVYYLGVEQASTPISVCCQRRRCGLKGAWFFFYYF